MHYTGRNDEHSTQVRGLMLIVAAFIISLHARGGANGGER